MERKEKINFDDCPKLRFWSAVVDKIYKLALFALGLEAGALGKGLIEMFL